jgi:hypothetical protein
LADLGADVIKVEEPEGDRNRLTSEGPHYHSTNHPDVSEMDQFDARQGVEFVCQGVRVTGVHCKLNGMNNHGLT